MCDESFMKVYVCNSQNKIDLKKWLNYSGTECSTKIYRNVQTKRKFYLLASI